MEWALWYMIIIEYMKVNGRMGWETAKVLKYSQMAINILDNINLEEHMESENTFGKMEIIIMEIGLME